MGQVFPSPKARKETRPKEAKSLRQCRRRLIIGLFSCLALCLAGCSQDQPGSRMDDLKAFQAQNDKLASENTALRERNNELQDDLDLLKAEYENLELQKEELKRWNHDLVKACGPSVWNLGIYEYPLPYKFFRKASLQQLLTGLNDLLRARHLPEVVIKEVKGSTAHLQIPEDTILTQQMGTTGAEAYLNAVAYTLCSIKEINCVTFEFHPGEHAMPGRLCPP